MADQKLTALTTLSALTTDDIMYVVNDPGGLAESRKVAISVFDARYQAIDAELTALAGLTSVADRVAYFTGSGTAALATLTSFARTLIDDVDAAAMRTTLGLVIGTNVQAQDAFLTSIAALGTIADRLIYTTGVDTAAEAVLTSFARTLLDDTTQAAMRTTLGLTPGTDVQAFDAELAAIAGLTSAADRVPYFTGSGAAALATFTAFGRSLIDDADSTAGRVTLGVVIGTNVQAWDADLDAIAALAKTDNNFIVGNGTAWVAESGATARTSLGLGSIATQAASAVAITGGTITGITDLAVADGGTGISTVPANGQIPIGNGTNYTAAVITEAGGITITNSAGGISLALKADISNTFLGVPGLRGLWNFGNFTGDGGIPDLSGQGRTLTYNGNPTFNYSGTAGYADLDGTGDYFSRNHEIGLDILGTESIIASAVRGMTFVGWFYFNNATFTYDIASKYNTTTSEGWRLRRGTSPSELQFTVQGATYSPVNASSAAWHLLGVRLDPGTDWSVMVDGVVTTTASAVPSSITSVTSPFVIGASSAPGGYMQGRPGIAALYCMDISDAILLDMYNRTRGYYGV